MKWLAVVGTREVNDSPGRRHAPARARPGPQHGGRRGRRLGLHRRGHAPGHRLPRHPRCHRARAGRAGRHHGGRRPRSRHRRGLARAGDRDRADAPPRLAAGGGGPDHDRPIPGGGGARLAVQPHPSPPSGLGPNPDAGARQHAPQ